MSTAVISTTPTGVLHKLDTDVTEAVTTALKQKGNGPFIGIPCGLKTVLIRRTVFKQSLAGLHIVSAEFIPMMDRQQAAIRVYAAGNRVKATRLYCHQNPKEYRNQLILKEWRAQQVKKVDKPKLNKYQKQIQKYERQLQKLGTLHRPANPVIVRADDLTPADEGDRHAEHLWKLQRPIRRAVMELARRAPKTMGTPQLYKDLAELLKAVPVYETANSQEIMDWLHGRISERPTERYTLTTAERSFKKWGELTANDRERAKLKNVWDYLQRLWEFTGLQSKPYRHEHTPDWGPERYFPWQAEKNARRELEYMIADLRVQEFEKGQ